MYKVFSCLFIIHIMAPDNVEEMCHLMFYLMKITKFCVVICENNCIKMHFLT